VLDLDHPMSQHIFAAARPEDAILMAARHMTAASREDRARLQAGCAPAFAELRRLSRDHFADCTAIPAAINGLEQALAQLAASGTVATGPRAEFKCPDCGGDLYRCDQYGFPMKVKPTEIYCSPCLDVIMPFLEILRGCEHGFGTDAI
jgi:hypothetical protein